MGKGGRGDARRATSAVPLGNAESDLLGSRWGGETPSLETFRTHLADARLWAARPDAQTCSGCSRRSGKGPQRSLLGGVVLSGVEERGTSSVRAERNRNGCASHSCCDVSTGLSE